MLESIRSFFRSSMTPTDEAPAAETDRHDLKLAACALLLELAHADDEFTEDERAHVESAIRRQFDLHPTEAERLLELAEAERAQAVDLWQFTSLINRSYTLAQKTVLAEIMWGLVYSDGEFVEREQLLLRKISNLLSLRPGYLAEARKRVRKRRGIEEE